MFKTIAFKIIIALAWIAPLTLIPVWSATLYPYIFIKVWLFRVVIEAMLLLYIPLAFAYPEFRPRRSIIWWGLSAFIASAVVSSILGVSLYKSFWGYAERMEGLFGLLHYAAYAVMLAGIYWRQKEGLLIVCNMYLGGALLATVSGIFDLLQEGNARPSSIAGNPAFFAAQMLFAAVFSMLVYSVSESAFKKWLYGGGAAVFMLMVLLTGTRSAFAGLAAGVAVFVLLLIVDRIRGQEGGMRRLFLAAGALMLLVALGWQLILKYRPISIDDANIWSRIDAMKVSVAAWKDRPLVGWGLENFNVAYNKHINPKTISVFTQRQWFDRAHNKVLDVLVMQGAVGIAAYAFILFALAWTLFSLRNTRPLEMRIGLSGIVAYGVHDLFVFDVAQSYIPLAMLIAWIAIRRRHEDGGGALNGMALSNALPASTGALLAFIVLIPSFWYGSVLPLRAAIDLQRAVSLDPRVNPSAPKGLTNDQRVRAIIEVDKVAISHRSFVTWEALLMLQRFYTAEVGGGLNVEKADLSFLANEFHKATLREPMQYEAYMAWGEILNIWGSMGEEAAYKDAEVVLGKATELAPNIPRVWYDKGALLMGQGKKLDAIKVFEHAVEINSDIGESHWRLGAAYLSAESFQQAADAFDIALSKGYEPEGRYAYEQLFQAYAETSQYAKVEPVLLKLIEFQPTNARWHAVLAATYKGMQQYDKARQEVQKAVELDVSYKEQADLFLKTLPK